MKTLKIDQAKNSIGLKIKTSKELKAILNSSKTPFIEKVRLMQEVLFNYKTQTFGVYHVPSESTSKNQN